MNKAAWFIWGHDAYWFRYCKKTPGNFIYEYIRRQLIHELGTLISPIKGDYEYVKAHYNTKGVYVNCRYPVPTNFELLKSLRRQNASKDAINVQIGNSANPTNNLEEMINFFGEFNNIDNYRFYCLLSYGDHEYAEKISQLGNKVLGKRFKPVINFMDRTEYANYIASIDILIMNHNRQQGLGNILSFLYLGKKVYLRSDNSLYAFFKENGIRVFNTLDLLKSRNLEEMVVIDAETINENREKTERLVAKDQIAKQWMQVFN
jgi:hypothetical protein